MFEHEIRQCESTKPHPWHIHLAIIKPGVRGVKDYRCLGVEKEDSVPHPS